MNFIQTVDNGYGPSVDNAYNPDPTSPYYANQGSPQSMSDRPGPHDPDTDDPSNWFTRLFFSWWHFETCAVCLDSGQPKIIGCVTWTIYYDFSGKAHMTGMTGPSGTALEPPSPGFNNTLNNFKNPLPSDYYSQPGEH